jgi:hypothetical protein
MANKKIDRKEFIKEAAMGAMGIATIGLLGSCATSATKKPDARSGASSAAPTPPMGGSGPGREWLGEEPSIPDFKIKHTWETEVLIVGAGTGGLFAACSAAEHGAKTMLIERNANSAGIKDDLGAIGSRIQKAERVNIDPQEIIADFVRYSGGYIDQRLHQLWARDSGEAVDWYIDRLQEKGIKMWLENSAGTPGTRDKDWVTGHSPEWTKDIKGGQFVLQPYAEARGVVFHYSTTLVKLEKKGGRVVGVIAKDEKDEYIRIKAGRGVILATGGYAANVDMMRALQPQTVPLYSKSSAGTTYGDGIKSALWAGAAMDTVHTSMLFDRCALKPGDVSGPSSEGAMFWLGSQPFLKVNLRGERFANESGPYDYILHSASTQPGNCYCTIFDAGFAKDVPRFDTVGCSRTFAFGNGAPPNIPLPVTIGMLEGLVKSGFAQVANSVAELAGKLRIPVDRFAATVERYNALVNKGVDEDFGKPAFRLSPISRPPYYGVITTGSMLCTLDGIRIDLDMHALDEKHDPIPGLFVCGNDSGGYYAVTYPNLSTGNAAGRTITFARRAGRLAAAGK